MYCHFDMDSSIVRTIPILKNADISFKLVVKSEYILKACKDVIQHWPGVSWHAYPLEVSTTLYCMYFANMFRSVGSRDFYHVSFEVQRVCSDSGSKEESFRRR